MRTAGHRESDLRGFDADQTSRRASRSVVGRRLFAGDLCVGEGGPLRRAPVPAVGCALTGANEVSWPWPGRDLHPRSSFTSPSRRCWLVRLHTPWYRSPATSGAFLPPSWCALRRDSFGELFDTFGRGSVAAVDDETW